MPEFNHNITIPSCLECDDLIDMYDMRAPPASAGVDAVTCISYISNERFYDGWYKNTDAAISIDGNISRLLLYLSLKRSK